MNDEGIKRIEELAAAAQTLPHTDVPAVVLPAEAKVESLEELLDRPRQVRRTYTTERLDDFCKYTLAEMQENRTAAFVQPDGSGATAIIDFGSRASPMWARHKAMLTMRHTSEFAALKAHCARALSQRQLTDWIEDWAHIVNPIIADANVALAKAIAAIRRVNVKVSRTATHEDADLRAARTSMEEIEARGVDVHLPELFEVTCGVYPCTEPRPVRARLSLLTGAEAPQFKLRIIGEDALMREVADEIEAKLTERLQGVRVFVGSV